MAVIFVYHGSSRTDSERFCREGIPADQPHRKKSCNREDQVPGIHVAPDLETAKRFADRIGDCVVEIEIDDGDLVVPPLLKAYYPDTTIKDCLENPLECQAYINKRVEPEKVKIVFYRELPPT